MLCLIFLKRPDTSSIYCLSGHLDSSFIFGVFLLSLRQDLSQQ